MMDPLLAPALTAKATEVVAKNRAAGRRVAVAESCTGGLVSAALTEVPGSSAVFEAGYVTYANSAKMRALGVSEDVLDTFGAVSIATAWAWPRARWNAPAPMSRWRSPALPARTEEALRSRSERWSSPRS
jgi:nicotinamide-nucleotide amidase